MANQYTARLSKEDVSQIMALIHEREVLLEKANELTHKKIAEKFDICRQMVTAIATGKTHKTMYAITPRKNARKA